MRTMKEKTKLEKLIGRSVIIQNALLMDALTKLRIEEFAWGMEQEPNHAALKVVRIMLKMEEYALGMERRSRSNGAAAMGALTKPNKEGFAIGTEQSANDAASMDAQTIQNEMEFAEDMGHFTILLTNPLHLLHHLDQHTMKRLQLFQIILLSQLLPTKIVAKILLA